MPAAPALKAPIPPDLMTAFALLSFMVVVGIAVSWAFILSRMIVGQPVLPAESRRPVPWGPLGALAGLGLFFVVQIVVINGYVLIAGVPIPAPGAKGPMIPYRSQLLLSGLADVITILLVPTLLFRSFRASPGDLGLTSRDLLTNLTRGVAACMAALPLVYGVMFLAISIWKNNAHEVQKFILEDRSATAAIISLMVAVIAAPVTEELIFRGVLLGWLWRLARSPEPVPETILVADESSEVIAEIAIEGSDTSEVEANPYAAPICPGSPLSSRERPVGMLLANVITSSIFAGLHYTQWPAPLPLFVLSMVMGFVYQRTRSLWAPIALHATFNGLSTIVMLLTAAAGIEPKI